MKRILLECGGKSASIFLDDAEVTDELLQRILFDGCSLHAGQACILHSRLLLPDSLHDDVVDRLVALARERQGRRSRRSRGADGSADQRGATRPRRGARRRRARATARRWSTGGGRPAGLDVGFYFEPTILTDVDAEFDDRPRGSVRSGADGAALPRRRRRGRDREQLAVRALRRGVGRRCRPRGRRRAPHPHRPDRGQRLRSRAMRRSAGSNRAAWAARAADIGGLHQYMEPKAIGIPGVTGPLAGLRVVEIAGEIAGPYCTKLLVDLGADVTKIEPPTGDPLRRWGPFPAASPTPIGRACSSTSTPESAAHTRSRSRCLGRHELIARRARAGRGSPAGNAGRLGTRRATSGAAQPEPGRACASPTSGSTGRCATGRPPR